MRSQPSQYLTIDQLVNMIEPVYRNGCTSILEENCVLFEQAAGSTHNHQTWVGGYIDHVTEVMNIAVILYECMNNVRCLPFSLSDILLVLFLHDIEKPWRFEDDGSGGKRNVSGLENKEGRHSFRLVKLVEYGIYLTPDQMNALTYVEGEHKDYSAEHRVMNPLAAFCHMCDVASARIWFDHPDQEHESWARARRFRSL